MNEQKYELKYVRTEGDELILLVNGTECRVNVPQAHLNNAILSPMPGLILKVSVNVGEHVKAGQTIAIMEAMKMENDIRATQAGIVRDIFIKTGDKVRTKQPLLSLEAGK